MFEPPINDSGMSCFSGMAEKWSNFFWLMAPTLISPTLTASRRLNLPGEPLYTIQTVAELLSVDATFILELIKTRKITGLHLDEKTLRIPSGSVQRYLAKLGR